MLGSIKAAWFIGGVVVSAGSAFVTTTLYINNLINQVNIQKENIKAIKSAINGETKVRTVSVTYNNGAINGCGNNSLLIGFNIGQNHEGNLYCATVDLK